MAATALRTEVSRRDNLQSETTEELRRDVAGRHRPHRNSAPARASHGAVAHGAAAMPRVAPYPAAPRPAARPAPRVRPRDAEETLEADEHFVAARRRVRRGHRRSGLPGVPALAATLLIGQLAFLLYVTSLGMAATHAAADLDERIAATTEEIKQSQKKISAATSTSQLNGWAARLHLRRVQQSDIDRVDETARPADMAPADMAPADMALEGAGQ